MRSLSDGLGLDKSKFVRSRQRKTQKEEAGREKAVVVRGTTTEESKRINEENMAVLRKYGRTDKSRRKRRSRKSAGEEPVLRKLHR